MSSKQSEPSSTEVEPSSSAVAGSTSKARRKVPVSVAKTAWKRPTTPVNERSVPSLHTSQKIPLDRFGYEDPVGFNEMYYKMMEECEKTLRLRTRNECNYTGSLI